MCPRPLTTDCLGGCGPLAVEGIPPGTGDPMQRRDPAERSRWEASRARRRRFCAAPGVRRMPEEGSADRRLSNAEGSPAGPSGAVPVGMLKRIDRTRAQGRAGSLPTRGRAHGGNSVNRKSQGGMA